MKLLSPWMEVIDNHRVAQHNPVFVPERAKNWHIVHTRFPIGISNYSNYYDGFTIRMFSGQPYEWYISHCVNFVLTSVNLQSEEFSSDLDLDVLKMRSDKLLIENGYEFVSMETFHKLQILQ